MWRKRNPCALLVGLYNKLEQSLWKTVWRFLKKLKIELPYVLTIPLLGIYQKKMKTRIRKDICTPMFIATLFTIAKIYIQYICIYTYNICVYIYISTYTHYTMEYYSTIEKNEILPFVKTWMDLGIMLSGHYP